MAKLLSDVDVQTFIRDGFIVLNCQNDFNPELHEKIADASKAIFKNGEKQKNPDDDVHKAIPEVLEVWSSPTVDGALRSLLGDEYIMHSHRHLHERLPGMDPEDQELHVDGTVGVTPVERTQLEPWFIIAFYYPEKTTIDMGPTAVVSGTHLLEHVPIQCPGDADPLWRPVERKLACEAGTVVLCDFRLAHKGCGNRSQKPRFMFKYNFLRTQVGKGASWLHKSPAWQLPPHPFLPKLTPVCLDIWNGFMLGKEPESKEPATVEANGLTQLHLLLPSSKNGDIPAVDLSEGVSPPDQLPSAALRKLVDLETEQAVQARVHALVAAAHCYAAPEELIEELVGTLFLRPSSRAAGLSIPGGTAHMAPPAGLIGGYAPGLQTDTTARAVAIAIGKVAFANGNAPSAAIDAFGRMLQATTAVAHHAAMGLAATAVRLQRVAQVAPDGEERLRKCSVADAFVRSAVLLLTSALGQQGHRRAEDQDVPLHGANGQPPLACALASALGHILSCVPDPSVAGQRLHLYTAALGAVNTAIRSGSVVDSDGVLAMGRIGSAAAAITDALTHNTELTASYRRLVRDSAHALRRLDAGEAGRPALDYHGSELARRFAEKWETKSGQEQREADDAADGIAATPDGALADVNAFQGKTVALVNRAQGGVLAISGAYDTTYDEGHEGEAHEGEAVAKGLATLRAVDVTGVPADDTATHFTLEPSGEADGSHFLVSVSSGRALHLDGLGDKLASVRYGDVRDGYSHFRLETVPGDVSGAVYVVNKMTRSPLHANGLDDQLVSTRFGSVRDDWAQWAVCVV
jgi:hypothetical protein